MNYLLFLPNDQYIRKITTDFNVEKEYIWYAKPYINIFHSMLYMIQTIFYSIKFYWQALKNQPNMIISSGGCFMLPFFFVSRMLSIPFHIYHFDAIPGKAVQWIGKFTSHQNPLFEHCIYDNTKQYCNKKSIVITDTYPIRFDKTDIYNTEIAKKKLGIPYDKIVILVLGGSQGAEELNTAILNALLSITDRDKYFIIHQTGKNDIEKIKKIYNNNGIQYIIFDFEPNLAWYYNAASIIMCRCGAGTLAEVAFFQKPALLCPLKNMAQNHQVQNAMLFTKTHTNSHIIENNQEIIDSILTLSSSKIN